MDTVSPACCAATAPRFCAVEILADTGVTLLAVDPTVLSIEGEVNAKVSAMETVSVRTAAELEVVTAERGTEV
jgi:hypothetical protein